MEQITWTVLLISQWIIQQIIQQISSKKIYLSQLLNCQKNNALKSNWRIFRWLISKHKKTMYEYLLLTYTDFIFSVVQQPHSYSTRDIDLSHRRIAVSNRNYLS